MDKPIPFALTQAAAPIPYKLGDVAPDHAMALVTCAGCGNVVAKPKAAPLACPLGCKLVKVA